MKRLWVFPLLFLILLLGAFQFRWYDGPLHKDGDYWVVYRTDRWTGHTWFYRAHLAQGSAAPDAGEVDNLPSAVETGGNESGRTETTSETDLASSALNPANIPTPIFLEHFIPAVDEILLRERVAKALETEEKKQGFLEVHYKMEDIARIIQANQEGHFNYIQAKEDYRLRRSRKGPSAEEERAHLAWSEATEAYKRLEQELSHLYHQVRVENAQIIQDRMVLKTKAFTIAWLVLVFFSLLLTVHYFICDVKQVKRINETFEVIEYHTRKDTGRGEGSSFNMLI
ncbi:MAG TPA: hypothetical protein VIL66_08330 [Bacillota bacterium]